MKSEHNLDNQSHLVDASIALKKVSFQICRVHNSASPFQQTKWYCMQKELYTKNKLQDKIPIEQLEPYSDLPSTISSIIS